MTTKMIDAQWTADPTQPGRIAAGDAITIDVRVAFWRVPGGPTEEARLVKEATALCLAATAMANALLAMMRPGTRPKSTVTELHTPACWDGIHAYLKKDGHGHKDCEQANAALNAAGIQP